MKIRKLLGDKILILPDEREKQTAGGIMLPDTAQPRSRKGVVIATGPGKRAEFTGNLMPMQVQVSDHVLYTLYSGADLDIEGVDHRIMQETELLAILEPDGSKCTLKDPNYLDPDFKDEFRKQSIKGRPI